MLSRVAEKVYWAARHIERVENTARLAKVYSQLMFDLPKSVKMNWYTLVQITSNESYFDFHYDARTEKNCMALLLSDKENGVSLISSLWWARENLRTTRDTLPREAWIRINELYLTVKDNLDDFESRSKRNALLDEVIKGCQAWAGMMASTMSQNDTYRFIKLGMAIERADMTSRILDVGGYFVAQETLQQETPYDSILWSNLLKSVSGLFMYRQKFQIELEGQTAVDFLLLDPEFARSISYCLTMIEKIVAKLPNNEGLLDRIAKLQNSLTLIDGISVGSDHLHASLDELQIEISQLHRDFYDVWFQPKIAA